MVHIEAIQGEKNIGKKHAVTPKEDIFVENYLFRGHRNFKLFYSR